jgi:hypothetical protein
MDRALVASGAAIINIVRFMWFCKNRVAGQKNTLSGKTLALKRFDHPV